MRSARWEGDVSGDRFEFVCRAYEGLRCIALGSNGRSLGEKVRGEKVQLSFATLRLKQTAPSICPLYTHFLFFGGFVVRHMRYHQNKIRGKIRTTFSRERFQWQREI